MEKRGNACDIAETEEYGLEEFVNYVIEEKTPEYVADTLTAGERILNYIKEEL